MKNEQSKEGLLQFIKFAIVGVANTGVDWVVYFILSRTILTDSLVVAKASSFTIAVLNSYLLNTIWTFKKEYATATKEGATGGKAAIFIKFMIVSLVGLGINTLVYKYSLDKFAGSELISLVFASGAAILWNFFANKLWTYKK